MSDSNTHAITRRTVLSTAGTSIGIAGLSLNASKIAKAEELEDELKKVIFAEVKLEYSNIDHNDYRRHGALLSDCERLPYIVDSGFVVPFRKSVENIDEFQIIVSDGREFRTPSFTLFGKETVILPYKMDYSKLNTLSLRIVDPVKIPSVDISQKDKTIHAKTNNNSMEVRLNSEQSLRLPEVNVEISGKDRGEIESLTLAPTFSIVNHGEVNIPTSDDIVAIPANTQHRVLRLIIDQLNTEDVDLGEDHIIIAKEEVL